jgi:sulfatase modifying factor 1
VTKRVLGLASIAVLAACGIDAVGQAIAERLPEDDPAQTDASTTEDGPSTADAAEASSEIDTGSDVAVDAPIEAGCPGGMIGVLDAGYCIDGTEVTEAKWAAFLAADAGTGMLPAACAYKTAFAAGSALGTTLPVGEVDWCDAYGYCAWAGKRLCASAEWTKACNGGTSRIYPYGDVFDDQKCNGGPLGAPTAPGTYAQCIGPIPGIVDMSGNMDEWDVECATQTGAADICQTRGGDWKNDSAGELMCTAIYDRPRNTILNYVGFRCCK